jgi:5'-nucleotidase
MTRELGTGWTHSFTGKKLFPLDMRPDDIDIVDIAHALSNINRFAGHTSRPYSVAQHSVLVSHHCAPQDAIWGLLHDASEYVVCDLCRPVKRLPGLADYRAAEYRAMLAVCDRFGLELTMPPSVQRADELLLVSEAKYFFGHQPLYHEWLHRPENGFRILDDLSVLKPWGWRVARARFLDRFNELTGSRIELVEPMATVWGSV